MILKVIFLWFAFSVEIPPLQTITLTETTVTTSLLNGTTNVTNPTTTQLLATNTSELTTNSLNSSKTSNSSFATPITTQTNITIQQSLNTTTAPPTAEVDNTTLTDSSVINTTTESNSTEAIKVKPVVPDIKPEDIPWQTKELSLATLVPHKQDDNGCVYNAIRMAIDDINSVDKLITYVGNDDKTNKLVKYDFKMKAYYGEVSNSVPDAVDTLHNTYKGRVKTATVGPPYTDLTNNIVEYSSVLGNTHISYVDAIEPLERFYVFFIQSTPSIDSQFRAASAFLNYFNWTHSGIVYDFSDLKYRKNAGNLREKITKNENINKKSKILTEQGIWSKLMDPLNLATQMDALQASGSRIILSLVSVAGARKVFCQAYHRQMFKPKVVWILFENLPDDWASSAYDEKHLNGTQREINCTEDELLTASDGYISIIKQGLRRDNKRTVSNMTADDFKARLQKAVGENVKCQENVAYAYDALWVLGKGYQALAKSTDLTTYFPHNYRFGYSFINQLFRLKFEALTGPLKYETVGSYILKRVGEISIWVHKKGEKPHLVGTHKTADNILDMHPESESIMFGSNSVPSDRATVIKEYLDFDKPLYITLWSIAFIGIVIAVGFLITAVLYMSDKATNLDSPLLNCTITLGSILCYMSVVVYGLDTRYVNKSFIPNVCFIFLCTLTVGFTLTFGGLFTKTWRLYKTFMTPSVVSNKQAEPKHIPECLLFIMIGVFLLIDAIILVSWGVWTPFYSEIHNITKSENLYADVIVVEQIVRCNCSYFTQLLIGVCCYKGVLLIFGIFLAWQTKNARIQVQNESRQIALAIYNVVVVSVIGVICASVLLTTTKHQALYAIVSVCILICTTFTLLLVFIPKLRKIMFPSSFTENERKGSKESNIRNGIYLKNNQKIQAGNRFSADMSSSYSSTTLNTQLSTDSTQNIPNIYHHNSLVDTLSAGSVVSYTSAFLATQQQQDANDIVESVPRPRSGIYIGTTILEELTENSQQHVDDHKDVNKRNRPTSDSDDEEKMCSNSSDISEAEDCLEQQQHNSAFEGDEGSIEVYDHTNERQGDIEEKGTDEKDLPVIIET